MTSGLPPGTAQRTANCFLHTDSIKLNYSSSAEQLKRLQITEDHNITHGHGVVIKNERTMGGTGGGRRCEGKREAKKSNLKKLCKNWQMVEQKNPCG